MRPLSRCPHPVGSLTRHFFDLHLHLGGGERTIGYRYTESILLVDAPVYVLGTIQENGGIGAPSPGDEGQRFVVSYRSEEALGKASARPSSG